jgi:hypothetical protein
MHLHSISPAWFTSVRRVMTACHPVRVRSRFGFLRALLDEYRRAVAAARRYDDLSARAAHRRGADRAEITRQVFDEYYADRGARRD